jgi:hypothetical protein
MYSFAFVVDLSIASAGREKRCFHTVLEMKVNRAMTRVGRVERADEDVNVAVERWRRRSRSLTPMG